MVSENFKSQIDMGNDIEAKVIMGQSLVMDPTGDTLDRMMSYAKRKIDNFIEEHDGSELNENRESWDKDYLNLQLTKLTGNFSEERIRHLKEVCGYIYEDKVKEIKSKQSRASSRNSNVRYENTKSSHTSSEVNIPKLAMVGGVLVAITGAITLKPVVVAVGSMVAVAGGVANQRNRR